MMRAMQHVPLDSSAPATPANGWPPLLLSRIERELTPFIGPLAGTLVRRAARRHDTPEALVLALAPSIEDAKERDAFVRACRRHTPWPSAPAAATVPAAPPAQATAAAPLRPPPTQSTLPSATPYPNASRRQAVTPRALSPHWRGVATRGQRDLALLPLWAAAAFAGVLLLASWFALNTRLDARAKPLFARIAAVPAVLQDPAAPAVAARPRLSAALSADVAAARLEVRDEAQRSIVTLPADALFAGGSARLDPRASDLLARVANALRSQPVADLGYRAMGTPRRRCSSRRTGTSRERGRRPWPTRCSPTRSRRHGPKAAPSSSRACPAAAAPSARATAASRSSCACRDPKRCSRDAPRGARPCGLALLVAGAGLAAAAVLAGFLAPLIDVAGRSPLATGSARLVAVGVLLCAAGAILLAQRALAARRNRALLAWLAQGDVGEREVAYLGRRFGQSLAQLRRLRLSGPERGRFAARAAAAPVRAGAALVRHHRRARARARPPR